MILFWQRPPHLTLPKPNGQHQHKGLVFGVWLPLPERIVRRLPPLPHVRRKLRDGLQG